MNRILDKFRRGERTIGTFTQLQSETAVDAIGYTGMDYVIIDTEHSPMLAETAAKCVASACAAGMSALVRVDSLDRSPILKMLDAGAHGIIVPQLETVEQARRLVSYAKFAPVGARGFCPTRDGGWGFAENACGGMDEYMAWANSQTLLLPQCETAGCLENIEEIAAMEGVDGILIGPFDLSIALNMPGRFEDDVMKTAIRRVQSACRAAGKLCIIFAGSAAAARERFEQGFDSVTMGLDTSMLIEAYRRAAAEALKGI